MNDDKNLEKIKDLISNQKYDEAEKLLNEYSKNLPQILNLLGLLYDQKAAMSPGKKRLLLQNKAINYLSRSLKLSSKDPITHSYLGHVYHHQTDLQNLKSGLKAIKSYQKARNLGLDRYQSSLNLGNAYRRIGETKQAENYYLEAKKLAKNLDEKISIYFNLTYFYFEENKLEKAKSYYKNFNTLFTRAKNKENIKLLKKSLDQLFG
ncbi:tetratricopeptide repeat protein [Candidatus Daviesbacteria bacterium]|nr:tetratricopeptide repeat protein [Candidatus Daviesbacteria bacterium]